MRVVGRNDVEQKNNICFFIHAIQILQRQDSLNRVYSWDILHTINSNNWKKCNYITKKLLIQALYRYKRLFL